MRYLTAVPAMLLAAACAPIPSLPPQSYVRPSDIVAAMQCEIHRARQRHPELLDGRNYTAKLSLFLIDELNPGFDGNFVSPSGLSTVVAVGANTTARRTAEFVVDARTETAQCNPPVTGAGQSWLLGGSLGLEEWLAKLAVDRDTVVRDKLGSYNYDIGFTLKPTGAFAPAYNIVPIPASNLKFGLRIGGSRSTQHLLTVNFTKVAGEDKKPEKPQEIIIAGFSPKAAEFLEALAVRQAKLAEIERLRGQLNETKRQSREGALSEPTADELEAAISRARKELPPLPTVQPPRTTEAAGSSVGQELIREQMLNSIIIQNQLIERGIQD